jgi:hypothetical protein
MLTTCTSGKHRVRTVELARTSQLDRCYRSHLRILIAQVGTSPGKQKYRRDHLYSNMAGLHKLASFRLTDQVCNLGGARCIAWS